MCSAWAGHYISYNAVQQGMVCTDINQQRVQVRYESEYNNIHRGLGTEKVQMGDGSG